MYRVNPYAPQRRGQTPSYAPQQEQAEGVTHTRLTPRSSLPLYAQELYSESDSTYLSPTHYMPVDAPKKGNAGLLALLGGLAILALKR